MINRRFVRGTLAYPCQCRFDVGLGVNQELSGRYDAITCRQPGANLDAIALRYAEELNLDVDYVKQYLDVNLDYHMDAAGVESLGVFYELAAKHRALNGVRRMEFL